MNKLLLLLACCCACMLRTKGQNRIVLLQSFDTLAISAKTPTEAQAAFRIIAGAPVAMSSKKEKANNCENRAELAFHLLKRQGFKPINFWIFKEGLIEEKFRTRESIKRSNGLSFNTGIGSQPYVFWRFHVAAGVILNNDTLIFDPWTQQQLIPLKKWALSFFRETSGRTAYVFPVTGQYNYFGAKKNGQVNPDKTAWMEKADKDYNQMYCGLCGFSSNKECAKRKNRKTIELKKQSVNAYMQQELSVPRILAERRPVPAGNW